MDTSTVLLAEFTSAEEAAIAHGLLRTHGIEAQLRIESAGGAYPQLPARVQGGTGVHVPVAQAREARAVLEAAQPPRQRSGRERGGALAGAPRDTAGGGAPGPGPGGGVDPVDAAHEERAWAAYERRGRQRVRWAARMIVLLVWVVPVVWGAVQAFAA